MEAQSTPGSLSPSTAVLAPIPTATPAAQGQEQTAQGSQTSAQQTGQAQESTGQPNTDLGGFRSVEELKKGYDELRAWNTRLSQEVSSVKQKLEGSQTVQLPQRISPQEFLDQFVRDPEEVFQSVTEKATQEAMRQVRTTLTLARVVEEAKAGNPDVVTPENEAFLASLARQAPIPEGTEPFQAAHLRIDFAIKGYRAFVDKVKASGVKAGEANAQMKAQAGFETGSVSVNSTTGLTKDAALKLLRDNPTEYARLWKEKPNDMLAAFSS